MDKYKIITKSQDTFILLILVALVWFILDILFR
jgi:hypothetical protein